MEGFTRLEAIAAPLPLEDVDTDRLLPAQHMKGLTRDGLGRHLLRPLRYDENGGEVADFVLNRPACREAEILVAGRNFGCGSSREHAVWALADFGIRCIVAPSFGEIFAINCRKNRLLLVTLGEAQCEALRGDLETACATMVVDLENQTVEVPHSGRVFEFTVDALDRRLFLDGLDDIGRTMALSDLIDRFEEERLESA